MTPQLVKQLNQLRVEVTIIIVIVVIVLLFVLKHVILSCLNSYNQVLDHFWNFWLKPIYVLQLLGFMFFLQEEHFLARF